MNTYIIFESLDNDVRREKAVEVHDDLHDAEVSQVMLQQDRAVEYNRARTKAFKDGRAFSEKKTSADYSYRFRIEEVK